MNILEANKESVLRAMELAGASHQQALRAWQDMLPTLNRIGKAYWDRGYRTGERDGDSRARYPSEGS